ncbi:MAG: hypothetical protein L6V80_02000 [Bacteroidales bacterium]|nr:MAG: hypothetical protein L6V80_02000 [Bacteroidales bacterium]
MLPIYLLYRGAAGLTSVHTALYRYIQPIVATVLALVRRQEHIDRANTVAAGLIVAAVIFTMIGFSHAKRTHQQKKSCNFVLHGTKALPYTKSYNLKKP